MARNTGSLKCAVTKFKRSRLGNSCSGTLGLIPKTSEPQPLPMVVEPVNLNEPYNPPPPTLTIYCVPDVIEPMIYAWGQSVNGTNGTEAGFRTDGKPEVGGYTVVRNNFTNQQMAQLLEVTNTTFAIFFTFIPREVIRSRRSQTRISATNTVLKCIRCPAKDYIPTTQMLALAFF